jgi:hypothetical protein
MSLLFPMADIIAGMRRLLPDPVDHLTVADAYGVHRPRPAHRPWVGLCMVAGLDGSTVVDDNSRALSSPTDTEVLIGLRALADVIVVGASTVRIEGYGPPSKQGQTIGVVTRSGEGLDFDAPLFTSGAGFVMCPTSAPQLPVPTVRAGIDTRSTSPRGPRPARRRLRPGRGRLDAERRAGRRRSRRRTEPHDLAGDQWRRRSAAHAGAPSLLRRMDLAHVCEDDGFLFTRYVRRGI